MVFFNYALRKLNAKIVYYGPGLCGKTTNLQWIHDHFEGGQRGKMLSLATEGDRTIFFDLLPIDIGSIRGMQVTLQLYTVPGQVHYNSTRQLVLRGADGVVFVADSQRTMAKSNLESLKNLEENLMLQGVELAQFPHVLQFNKRDLRDTMSVEEMDGALNQSSMPIFEATAIEGIGVQETLEGIVKLVMRNLRERYEPVVAQGPKAPERPAATAGPWPVAAPMPAGAPQGPRPPQTPVAPASPVAAPHAATPPAPSIGIDLRAETQDIGPPPGAVRAQASHEEDVGEFVLRTDADNDEFEIRDADQDDVPTKVMEAPPEVIEPAAEHEFGFSGEVAEVGLEDEVTETSMPVFEQPDDLFGAASEVQTIEVDSLEPGEPEPPAPGQQATGAEVYGPEVPEAGPEVLDAKPAEAEALEVEPAELKLLEAGTAETEAPWAQLPETETVGEEAPEPEGEPAPAELSEPILGSFEAAALVEPGAEVEVSPVILGQAAADDAWAAEAATEVPSEPLASEPSADPFAVAAAEAEPSYIDRVRAPGPFAELSPDAVEPQAAGEALFVQPPEPQPVALEPEPEVAPAMADAPALDQLLAAEAADEDAAADSIAEEAAVEASEELEAEPPLAAAEPAPPPASPVVPEVIPPVMRRERPVLGVGREVDDLVASVLRPSTESPRRAEPTTPPPAASQPFIVGSGDPFTEEDIEMPPGVEAPAEAEKAVVDDAQPSTPEVSAVLVPTGDMPSVSVNAIQTQRQDTQLRVQLQGTGAIADYGDLREMDIVVPVPGPWIGNRRVTMQLRLTFTPVPEDEDGEANGPP